MKNCQFMILVVVMSLLLGACSSSTGTKVGSSGKTEQYVEYYGTYEKVSEGELEGNYFEDYEAVPLEDYTGSKTITLKSNGTYESYNRHYYSDTGELYREVTRKYQYQFKDNQILRERNLDETNYKAFKKLYYNDNGEFAKSERDQYDEYDLVKEEEDYALFDVTTFEVNDEESVEHDGPDNHLEYDFINVEGQLISVNYYKDDDQTKVSIYKKID